MPKMPIITLAGKAGSGKDTAADHLRQNYSAATFALADPMKRFAMRLVGFTEDQLWGPSQLRNAPVNFRLPPLGYAPGELDLEYYGGKFFTDCGLAGDFSNQLRLLKKWYNQYIWTPIEKEGHLSPRVFLQTLGTEWGRQMSPLMWIDRAIYVSKSLVRGDHEYTRLGGLVYQPGKTYDYAVITDSRFRTEVLGVIEAGGAAFRINRPSQAELTAGIAGHRSEKELDGIPRHFYDETIMNVGTIRDLYDEVDTVMALTFGDTRTVQ